jgi:hypothetical protein
LTLSHNTNISHFTGLLRGEEEGIGRIESNPLSCAEVRRNKRLLMSDGMIKTFINGNIYINYTSKYYKTTWGELAKADTHTDREREREERDQDDGIF